MKRVVSIAVLTFVTIGCGGLLTNHVEKRAPFDLSCPPEQVDIVNLGNRTYGATGCGHKATYIVSCSEENGCIAILNSLDESVTDRSIP